MHLVQLDELYEGQPIAVITTTLGVMRVALFPEHAPNTVANFVALIEAGFYDDSPIFAVTQGEAFFAGVNTKSEIMYDNVLENEYSVNLWPFRGALASYGDRQGISDSRFFIINDAPLTEEQWAQLRTMPISDDSTLPAELLDAFEERGGAFTHSGFFTIFGQIINDGEGLEVAETIANTETDRRSRPVQEIKIITVELEREQ
jgi:peptidyl-prolyl cis-trans isomerase B (cyclophilin B)